MPDFLPDDAELDRQLRGVSLPDGMLTRLQNIGAMADDELDHAINDVSLPAGLLHRLRGIPRTVTLIPGLSGLPLQRYALAASVLILVGVVYFATLGALLFSAYRGDRGQQPVANVPAADDRALVDRVVADRDANSIPNPSRLDRGLGGSSIVTIPPAGETNPRPGSIPAPNAASGVGHLAGSPIGPTEKVAPQLRADEDVTPGLHRSNIFASPAIKLPLLAAAPALKPRGVSPPRAKGYDYSFQLVHGVHPMVSPAMHPSLRVSHVPLVTETASYDALREAIERGRQAPTGRVRLEEILAAMDYQFPAPTQSVIGIRTAAGPGPLSAPGTTMLQIGVQAAELPSEKKSPVHVTIVLDASASMDLEGRVKVAQRAISESVDRLGPQDRMSLVVFHDKAELLAEIATADDVVDFRTAVDKIAPSGAANLGAGVQLAAELAGRSPAPADRRRLLLITDGLAELDASGAAHIEKLLSEIAAVGGKFDVVDLGQDEAGVDSQLSRFGKIGGGQVYSAASVDGVSSALAEVVSDGSRIVASNARLKVTFNPDVVASYRLLGHEATTGGGLLSAPIAADLKAGQAATALYEIVLRPEGSGQVATAEVSWYEPGNSKQHTLTQPVSRLQFATTFAESPLPLQLASVAATFGEIVRGSYFAPSTTHSLRRLREVSTGVNARLRDNTSFVELMSLVDGAQKLGIPAGRPAAK